jgi:hypothetical protein
MPKAISLALIVVIGSPAGPRRSAQTVVRAGVGPGDEAVERDRDASDNLSHARADPIRRPNSSLTHGTCGKCELDSTTREATRRTYSGRSPPSTSEAHMHRSKGMASLCPEWPGEGLRPGFRNDYDVRVERGHNQLERSIQVG